MSKIDRQELQDVLFKIEDHLPADGPELARKARQIGASRELVDFFETIPEELHDESQVMDRAETLPEPSVSEGPSMELDLPDEKLTMEDVIEGDPNKE